MSADRWPGFEMHRSFKCNRRSEAAGNTDRPPDQPNRRRRGWPRNVVMSCWAGLHHSLCVEFASQPSECAWCLVVEESVLAYARLSPWSRC